MKLKGIIDCDLINYKQPVMTLEFPTCDFKCDKLNGCQVCQNLSLVAEPTISVTEYTIWDLYNKNPITKGICCQGLEPLDSEMELYNLIDFIRAGKNCNDPIIIYTGYNKEEKLEFVNIIRNYPNIIIKWGRYIVGQQPHYDEVLGANLASDNQYAELVSKPMPISV
jgi:hypothetical protein